MQNLAVALLFAFLFVGGSGCTSVDVKRYNEKTNIHQSASDWRVVESWNEQTEKTVKIWPGVISWIIDWPVAPFNSEVREEMLGKGTGVGSWFAWGLSPLALPFSWITLHPEDGQIPCYTFGHGRTIEQKESIVRSGSGSYPGPVGEEANTVQVIINSEPQGAKVYDNGRFVGVTPVQVNYPLEGGNYQGGYLHCATLTAALDGYLPTEICPIIPVKEEWKYKIRQTFESSKGVVFFMRSDPNYRNNTVAVQRPSMQPDRSASDSDRQAAQSEYNVALAAYKEALQSRDNARNMKAMSNISYSQLMSGNNVQKGLGLFNQTTSTIGIQQAERDLEPHFP